jgi:hypothetical protein
MCGCGQVYVQGAGFMLKVISALLHIPNLSLLFPAIFWLHILADCFFFTCMVIVTPLGNYSKNEIYITLIVALLIKLHYQVGSDQNVLDDSPLWCSASCLFVQLFLSLIMSQLDDIAHKDFPSIYLDVPHNFILLDF